MTGLGLASALALILACGGSQSRSSAPLEHVAPEEDAAADGAPAVVTLDEALMFLPPSTHLVFGSNVRALASAEILRPYLARLEKGMPELTKMKPACGVDPIAEIDWIVIGIVGKDGVLAMGSSAGRDRLLGCVRAMAQKNGQELVVDAKNGIETWTQGDEPLLVFWPSDRVMIVTKHNRRDLLEEAQKGRGLGADVAGRVAAVDRSGAMWAAGVLPPDNADSGLPVEALAGFEFSVHAGATLDISTQIDFDSEAAAREAESKAQLAIQMAMTHPMAQPFVSIIDKLELLAKGSSLTAAIQLTATDLETLRRGTSSLGGLP